MKIIGLSGGIASGKSTAAKFLVERGIAVIDCDLVARDVVRKVIGYIVNLNDQCAVVMMNDLLFCRALGGTEEWLPRLVGKISCCQVESSTEMH